MSYNNFKFSTYDLLVIGRTPIPIIPSVIGVLKTNINSNYTQDIDYGYKKELDENGNVLDKNSNVFTQFVKYGNTQIEIEFILGTGGSGISNYTTPLVRALKGIASAMGFIRPEMLATTAKALFKPDRKQLSNLYKASYFSMEGTFIKNYDIISIGESQNLDTQQIQFNLVLQESQEENLGVVLKGGNISKGISNYIDGNIGKVNSILTAG